MSLLILWLLINIVLGIKWGLLFWGEKAAVWHILYYIGMTASFIWVVLYLIKKWKNLPKVDDTNNA